MKQLTVQSHKGPYTVHFTDDPFTPLANNNPECTHCLIDKRIAKLYAKPLAPILEQFSVILIEATEQAKSLQALDTYVEALLENNVRKDHTLMAIGGGIVQDITCFLASTLFRGMVWEFVPTTLLAQADSCIGSKSSINVGNVKNLMGTFFPPRKIISSHVFLPTLTSADFNSGVGEMLKVHVIAGPEAFAKIAALHTEFAHNFKLLGRFVAQSLQFKKRLTELDEFDQGPRNVMNYGHSFGHAIEAASQFSIPHGIAVTLGMDLANYVAHHRQRLSKQDYLKMSTVFRANAAEHRYTKIDKELFFSALAKDKKNIDGALGVILLNKDLQAEKVFIDNDVAFQNLCSTYLQVEMAS